MRKFDSISTRDAFGEALVQLADEHDNIMYICADTLKSVGGSLIHEKYPERALNVGIAEQNMILMAAGMAASGAKVFAATYSTFASMRICEQIRTFIAYPNLDVTIVAGLGGLTGGIEGVTHQGTEDIGIMRVIPNMKVICAADAASTKVITREIAKIGGPVYFRIGRYASPTVFTEDYTFTLGKANIVRSEGEITILSYGQSFSRCVIAADILEEKGIHCRVVETPCLKPFDYQTVADCAKSSKLIVTVEDHNVIGGLGTCTLEAIAESGGFVPSIRIGLEDTFGASGDCEELLDYFGITPENIAYKIEDALK